MTFTKSDLVLSLGQRLLLLLCTFLICFVLTAAASYLLGRVLAANPAAAVRISAVTQDFLTFIIPAIVTALLVTRRPAELLALTRRPSLVAVAATIVAMGVSLPAQEAIIYWNYHISLPEALAGFEAAARAMESAAGGTMRLLMADTSTPALILNLLIVGLLAALSEELLFRGCFQRLLTTGGVNRHVAVWAVAFCFSALHMQLFGFVPRLLLGAFFGYLLLWSGSLWLPVTAHALNNTLFVLSAWHQVRAEGAEALDAAPELWPAWLTVASIAATAAALLWLRKCANGKTLPS
ncbi:MAG: CPBP family glutamic-type intramembrane protease [Muribaculaceae bacterium]|nr:CPBP family glutamic-type intramembrane protease [Muribaculaceae bacterium]